MSVQQVDTMPPNSPQEAVYVLGVRVDRVSQQQALNSIEQMIIQHKSSPSPLPCQQIITVNPEFVMTAQRVQEFRIAINSAALVVADGTGVVWATRYLGRPAPERLTGTDLLPVLAQRCAASGYRLYLLGAAPGIAGMPAAPLQHLAPALQLAGTYPGSPVQDEAHQIIERVRTAPAHLLSVPYA